MKWSMNQENPASATPSERTLRASLKKEAEKKAGVTATVSFIDWTALPAEPRRANKAVAEITIDHIVVSGPAGIISVAGVPKEGESKLAVISEIERMMVVSDGCDGWRVRNQRRRRRWWKSSPPRRKVFTC